MTKIIFQTNPPCPSGSGPIRPVANVCHWHTRPPFPKGGQHNPALSFPPFFKGGQGGFAVDAVGVLK